MARTLLAIALTLVVVCGNTAENGSSCPVGCVCTTATAASCREVSHDGIPVLLNHLPATTWSLEVLNITTDRTSTPDVIADIAAAKLPGLTELTLTNCRIRDVRSGHFAGLGRVSRLNLSTNFLTSLQDGVFTPLASLRVLNLSSNCISDVNNKWLKGLDTLQVLDLSSNNISTLEEAAFVSLPALQRLIFSGNSLSVVLPSSLSGLNGSLQFLDLSYNTISLLNDSVFGTLESLRVLNLRGNYLEVLKGKCFYGLAGLQQLDVSSNRISLVDDGVFSELNSLQRLNLSGNRIEALGDQCFNGLAHLQQLDVSRNRISSVSPGTFQSVGGLTEVVLADNPVLGRLRQELMVLVGTGRRLQTVDVSRSGLTQVPAALTRSIRTLRLAGNSVTTVRCGDLDSYPLLQLLDLADNQIVELEEDALGRLEVLSILYLSGNLLQAVPRSLPSGLRTLHLQRNRIQQLNSGDLQGLPRLKYLSFRKSGLASIQNGALSQLAALETLDISDNPLKSLPGNALSGPLMSVLRLSSLGGIKSSASETQEMSFPVTSPERLEVLELDSSPVLARQLLADTAALAAFRQLRELNLGNSGLTTLRSDLFHFLPRLRTLRLNGNPWECENMLWLANWIRQQQRHQQQQLQSSLEDAYCASPPHLVSTPVIRLQDADFHVTTSGRSPPTGFSTSVEIDSSESTTETRYDASLAANMFPVIIIYSTPVPEQLQPVFNYPASSPAPDKSRTMSTHSIETSEPTIDSTNPDRVGVSNTTPIISQLENSSSLGTTSNSIESNEFTLNTTTSYEDDFLTNIPSAESSDTNNTKHYEMVNFKTAYETDITTEAYSEDYVYNKSHNQNTNSSTSPPINLPTDDNTKRTEIVFTTTSSSKPHFINIKVINTVHNKSGLAPPEENTTQTNDKLSYNTKNVTSTQNQSISSNTVIKIVHKNITNSETHKIYINTAPQSARNLFANRTWSQHKFFPNSKTKEFSPSVEPFNRTIYNNINLYRTASHLMKIDTIPTKQTNFNKDNQKLKLQKDRSFNNIMQGDESRNRDIKETMSENAGETHKSLVNKTSEKPTINTVNVTDQSTVKNTNSMNFTAFLVIKHEYTNTSTDHPNLNLKIQDQNTLHSSVQNSVPRSHSMKIPTEFHTNKLKLVDRNSSVSLEEVASKHGYATSSGMNNSGNITYINSTSNKTHDKSENGTELSLNTTTPLEGENLVFENVTLAMSDKSVFYSSRASDAFASGVRVTVKENVSTSLIMGSHPGMFVLLGVGLAMAGALAMAVSHCAKRRRRLAVEYSRQQDIEVRSMSSIGDLW